MATERIVRNDHSDDLLVFFANEAGAAEVIAGPSIVITEHNDNWNDFGFRTKANFRLRTRDGVVHSVVGMIGFVDSEQVKSAGIRRLLEILTESGKNVVLAAGEHRFFTMLPSMDAYRSLISKFGLKVGVQFLLGMNDLVAISEFEADERLQLAQQSEVFNRSFIRMIEAFYAFKNGGAILRGVELDTTQKASTSFNIKFRLAGRENDHDLTFHFDKKALLPRRISVIIGKNGVGKSQTLGRMVRAALSGDLSFTDANTGERPLFNRLLAFAPTNEAGSVFPTDKRKRSHIWYRRFSLNRGARSKSSQSIVDMIVHLVRTREDIGGTSRFELFVKSLESIEHGDELALVTRSGGYKFIRTLGDGSEQKMLDGLGDLDSKSDPVRVVDSEAFPLSSGEISFLRFATQASLYVENGSLLLLDEPETHLHPNFISQLVLMLDSLLRMTKSYAIIATHSVYFVREVFHDQVIVLRSDKDRRVFAEHPTLRTFGADVGAISYFVFGEDESTARAAKVEKAVLRLNQDWATVFERLKNDLSLEMLGTLRERLESRDQDE
jgi:ABC-type branched-subunit amino acid transport system ATPase component